MGTTNPKLTVIPGGSVPPPAHPLANAPTMIQPNVGGHAGQIDDEDEPIHKMAAEAAAVVVAPMPSAAAIESGTAKMDVPLEYAPKASSSNYRTWLNYRLAIAGLAVACALLALALPAGSAWHTASVSRMETQVAAANNAAAKAQEEAKYAAIDAASIRKEFAEERAAAKKAAEDLRAEIKTVVATARRQEGDIADLTVKVNSRPTKRQMYAAVARAREEALKESAKITAEAIARVATEASEAKSAAEDAQSTFEAAIAVAREQGERAGRAAEKAEAVARPKSVVKAETAPPQTFSDVLTSSVTPTEVQVAAQAAQSRIADFTTAFESFKTEAAELRHTMEQRASNDCSSAFHPERHGQIVPCGWTAADSENFREATADLARKYNLSPLWDARQKAFSEYTLICNTFNLGEAICNPPEWKVGDQLSVIVKNPSWANGENRYREVSLFGSK